MTDIVERLRKASVYEEYKAILSNLGDEAADEIERLRALLQLAESKLRGDFMAVSTDEVLAAIGKAKNE